MSRGRDAIEKQATSQGWEVVRVDWEPVGAGAEKSGPSGGWDVDLRRGDVEEWAGGYNLAQVLEWIRNLDRPYAEKTDPFSCCGKGHSLLPGDCMSYRGHRGAHYPKGGSGR